MRGSMSEYNNIQYQNPNNNLPATSQSTTMDFNKPGYKVVTVDKSTSRPQQQMIYKASGINSLLTNPLMTDTQRPTEPGYYNDKNNNINYRETNTGYEFKKNMYLDNPSKSMNSTITGRTH